MVVVWRCGDVFFFALLCFALLWIIFHSFIWNGAHTHKKIGLFFFPSGSLSLSVYVIVSAGVVLVSLGLALRFCVQNSWFPTQLKNFVFVQRPSQTWQHSSMTSLRTGNDAWECGKTVCCGQCWSEYRFQPVQTYA